MHEQIVLFYFSCTTVRPWYHLKYSCKIIKLKSVSCVFIALILFYSQGTIDAYSSIINEAHCWMNSQRFDQFRKKPTWISHVCRMGFTGKTRYFLHSCEMNVAFLRDRMSFLTSNSTQSQSHTHGWNWWDMDRFGGFVYFWQDGLSDVCVELCWEIVQMMTKVEKGSLVRGESV